MRKKAGMAAFAAYCFIGFMLLFGVDGQAYIDPSVMTYVIQAVAGIVIAVGAATGIYWRKVRKRFQEKMGTDEEKHKETETDDIIVK